MIAKPHSIDVRQHILDTAQRIIGGKGFAAVGLNEILGAANVPKGSFYHYFDSKDAFGTALLESYFEVYLADLNRQLSAPGRPVVDRLLAYWQNWIDTQGGCDPEGKCLAVKLGAEVADLSEAMRAVLERGTKAIIKRLGQALEDGIADGSLKVSGPACPTAETLYQTWLGASLMAKISRSPAPLEAAMRATRMMLHLDTPCSPHP
ncbi:MULTISPECIES: TetR/AcrR family transcriptional regulator [Nitrospirillum]|uniref:TetR family transcriptional regulator n=1 Tax=Nitrospirillum amazonense TaxID=28077 RepID=A0A560F5B0_9PROT|nr:TetR/AcrR family transcriptional regulator [Nitrospirillum amazonense]MEC4589898.1 TetR/AcrR family transcriptional regulator [Nitrospirillum amazonense]TWB16816.1 TetR family transcriptional regulator [Nitrospirillum amazonense]